jgi:hypothetical protein
MQLWTARNFYERAAFAPPWGSQAPRGEPSALSRPFYTRATAGAGELPSLVKEGWLRDKKSREATLARAAAVGVVLINRLFS